MRKSLSAAVFAFLGSRAILFALLIFVSQLAFIQKVHSGSTWETRGELTRERLGPELERSVMSGDAWWYRSIVVQGYGPRADAGGAPNYAFFPLYPLLVRAVSLGNANAFPFAGALLSNICFTIALLLLAKLGVLAGFSVEESHSALAYLAFFPTSYFLSLPLPESLFLMLSIATLVAAYSGRWELASGLGAMAALTRLPGILLLVPLVILFLQRERRVRARALWLLLLPCATLGFVIYLHQLTGSWRAFLAVQEEWGRSPGFFWSPVLAFLAEPWKVSEPWNFLALNAALAALLAIAGVMLLIRRQWGLGAYTIASLLLPLSTGSLQSLGRYALVAFPLFLWLGTMVRRPLFDRVFFGVLVTLYGWLIAMYALRVDFALA